MATGLKPVSHSMVDASLPGACQDTWTSPGGDYLLRTLMLVDVGWLLVVGCWLGVGGFNSAVSIFQL